MFIEYNPNPVGRHVGDCSVRAISKALNIDWETAYVLLSMNGFSMGDMPSSDSVWGATLRQRGYSRKSISDLCPDCYTAEDFCRDHPQGTFVLGFGGHVATVHDGILFDSWNSSQEVPQFYWTKEEKEEEDK